MTTVAVRVKSGDFKTQAKVDEAGFPEHVECAAVPNAVQLNNVIALSPFSQSATAVPSAGFNVSTGAVQKNPFQAKRS